jgi:ATP-binding protein involved in chromosome partitioning
MEYWKTQTQLVHSERKCENKKIGILKKVFVENISGFVYPTCRDKIDIFRSGGGKRMAEKTSFLFLGSIPIDPNANVDSDKGSPFVIEHPKLPSSTAFIEIIKKVESYLSEKRV